MSFIQSNNQEEVVVQQIEQFWGLRDITPIAFNPTKKELQKLGVNSEKEPEYIKLKENITVATFRFWVTYKNLKNEVLKSFVSFDVRNQEFESTTGKRQYIDLAGNTAWAVDLQSVSETSIQYGFKVDTARPAYIGEEALVNFLKTWFNVKPGDACRPDNYKKEFEGDFVDFKSIFKDPNSKNELRALFVVSASKGNVYQNLYNGYFQRKSNSGLNNWIKHFAAQQKYMSSKGKSMTILYPTDFVFAKIPDEIINQLITSSLGTAEETTPKTNSFSEEQAGF